jgi:hypothetical protein
MQTQPITKLKKPSSRVWDLKSQLPAQPLYNPVYENNPGYSFAPKVQHKEPQEEKYKMPDKLCVDRKENEWIISHAFQQPWGILHADYSPSTIQDGLYEWKTVTHMIYGLLSPTGITKTAISQVEDPKNVPKKFNDSIRHYLVSMLVEYYRELKVSKFKNRYSQVVMYGEDPILNIAREAISAVLNVIPNKPGEVLRVEKDSFFDPYSIKSDPVTFGTLKFTSASQKYFYGLASIYSGGDTSLAYKAATEMSGDEGNALAKETIRNAVQRALNAKRNLNLFELRLFEAILLQARINNIVYDIEPSEKYEYGLPKGLLNDAFNTVLRSMNPVLGIKFDAVINSIYSFDNDKTLKKFMLRKTLFFLECVRAFESFYDRNNSSERLMDVIWNFHRNCFHETDRVLYFHFPCSFEENLKNQGRRLQIQWNYEIIYNLWKYCSYLDYIIKQNKIQLTDQLEIEYTKRETITVDDVHTAIFNVIHRLVYASQQYIKGVNEKLISFLEYIFSVKLSDQTGIIEKPFNAEQVKKNINRLTGDILSADDLEKGSDLIFRLASHILSVSERQMNTKSRVLLFSF